MPDVFFASRGSASNCSRAKSPPVLAEHRCAHLAFVACLKLHSSRTGRLGQFQGESNGLQNHMALYRRASLVAQMVKNPPAMWET